MPTASVYVLYRSHPLTSHTINVRYVESAERNQNYINITMLSGKSISIAFDTEVEANDELASLNTVILEFANARTSNELAAAALGGIN